MVDPFDALRRGAFSELRGLEAGSLDAFSPSLICLAQGSPAQDTAYEVLASLPSAPRAVAYSRVDFHAVRSELQAAPAPSPGREQALAEADAAKLRFERAGEAERVVIALRALRGLGACPPAACARLGERGIFSSPAFVPELSVLLPVLLSRLPLVITPVEAVERLLTVPQGPALVCAVAANHPLALHPISSALAHAAGGRDPALAAAASESIHAVCRASPAAAREARNVLARTPGTMPLAIHVTIDYVGDVAEFTLGAVVDDDTCGPARACLTGFHITRDPLARRAERVPASAPEHAAGSALRGALLRAAGESLKSGWGDAGHTHLRLVCIMLAEGLAPSNEEVAFWLGALLKAPAREGAARDAPMRGRTRELAVCFLALLPNLVDIESAPAGQGLIFGTLRRALADDSGGGGGVTGGDGGYRALGPAAADCPVVGGTAAELGVWLRAHMLLRRHHPMAEWACAALGAFVPVNERGLREVIRAAGAAGMLNEAEVAAAAARLPPPWGIRGAGGGGGAGGSTVMGARPDGQLLVEAWEQLLSSGLLRRCGVDLGSAVGRLILGAAQPLFPALPSLVKSMASASVPVLQPGMARPLRSIPLESLRRAWALAPLPAAGAAAAAGEAAADPLCGAALATYYVLCREAVTATARHHPAAEHDAAGGEEYGGEGILMELPLEDVRSGMEAAGAPDPNAVPQDAAGGSFAALIPDWSSLVAQVAPERVHLETTAGSLLAGLPSAGSAVACGRMHALLASELSAAAGGAGGAGWTAEELRAAMRGAREDPLRASLLLESMCGAPVPPAGPWERVAAVVDELVPALLDRGCEPRLQHQFLRLWHALPPGAVGAMIPRFVRALRGTWGDKGELRSLENLQLSPLELLSGDPRLFRTPLLLQVATEVLTYLLVASRRRAEAACGLPDCGITREEVDTALLAQESAAAQLLLEGCLPGAGGGGGGAGEGEGEGEGGEEAGLVLECREVIFAALQGIFARHLLVLKVVHFQGYDLSLVPAVVAAVPIIHYCIDFVPELLAQGRPGQVLMGVALAGELAVKYPTPRTLACGEQALARVRATAAARGGMLAPALLPLARCAGTFPQLVPELLQLLKVAAHGEGEGLRSAVAAAVELVQPWGARG